MDALPHGWSTIFSHHVVHSSDNPIGALYMRAMLGDDITFGTSSKRPPDATVPEACATAATPSRVAPNTEALPDGPPPVYGPYGYTKWPPPHLARKLAEYRAETDDLDKIHSLVVDDPSLGPTDDELWAIIGDMSRGPDGIVYPPE